ncbi:MAG: hypothetical protein QGG71_15850 [Pirellulaceae bacterium]|jgi:diacylglycerol kinase|nr:hypothetical protein [Pirellulaceae bacterium]
MTAMEMTIDITSGRAHRIGNDREIGAGALLVIRCRAVLIGPFATISARYNPHRVTGRGVAEQCAYH